MPLGEIGIGILVLLGIVIFGNFWFHFVESLLARIKGRFSRHQEPPAWHPLPPEQKQDDEP